MESKPGKPVSVATFKKLVAAWGELPTLGIDRAAVAGLGDDDPLPSNKDCHSDGPVTSLHVFMKDDGSIVLTADEDKTLDWDDGWNYGLIDVFEDRNGAMNVELGDVTALEAPRTINLFDPTDALTLLEAAEILEIDWNVRADGSAAITHLNGVLKDRTPSRRPDVTKTGRMEWLDDSSPEQMATGLLINLAATVLNEAEICNQPDRDPPSRMRVSMTRDYVEQIKSTLITVDEWSYRLDDTDELEFVGRLDPTVPPFVAPFTISSRHDLDYVNLSPTSFLVQGQGGDENEIDDFVADMAKHGWGCEVEETGVANQFKFNVRWAGRMWSFSKTSLNDWGERMIKQHPNDSGIAADADEALRYAGLYPNEGVARFVTKSQWDGELVVLYNAGDGWRENLSDAFRVVNIEKQSQDAKVTR